MAKSLSEVELRRRFPRASEAFVRQNVGMATYDPPSPATLRAFAGVQSPLHGKKASRRGRSGSRTVLEDRFLEIWNRLGGPALQREVRVCKERRWRFDFAHASTRTAIEIEGGIFAGGRHHHVRADGYTNDCQKYLTAAVGDWTVLRLSSQMIDDAHVGLCLAVVERKIGKVLAGSP